MAVTQHLQQGRCNEGFNAEPIAFSICILHFESKFPAKNSDFFQFQYLNFRPKFLDSIVEVVVVGATQGDNRHTSSFGHSVLFGIHYQNVWVRVENLGLGENVRFR